MQGTTKNLIAAVAALTVLSGCAQISESRFNPLNWFGGSSEEATTLAGDISKYQGPPDTSVQIAELVSMKVDRMPGGAIITAEGVAPIQGFWEPKLVVADSEDPGTITLDFRIQRPFRQHPAGAVPTRTVSAGAFLSDAKLRNVNRIIVRGASTQRVSSR